MHWRHYYNSQKYLLAVLANFKPVDIFACEEGFGWRRKFFKIFPITIECRVSEIEPVLDSVRGLRIVLWDKRVEKDELKIVKVKGWWQARGVFSASAPTQAFLDLQEENIVENYFKHWDETTRRYRNRWSRQTDAGEVYIEKVSKELYLQSYEQGLLSKSLKKFFIQKMHNFDAVYGEYLEYLLAFDKAKKVLGGLSYVHDMETNQSIHFTAFVTKAGDKTAAGVGLIDFWVRECIVHRIPFATLGIIWSKGQPKSWRGYGNFKLHFRPAQVAFRNVYVKLTFKT